MFPIGLAVRGTKKKENLLRSFQESNHFSNIFKKTCVTSGSFTLIKLTICESLKSPLDQTNRNKLRSSEMR